MINRRHVRVFAVLAVGMWAGAAPLSAQEQGEREIVGSWQGPLEVPGGGTLRLVFHVQRDSVTGSLTSTLDSPDQGAMGISVSETVVSGDSVRFTIAAIGGTFEGEWSADGAQITGTWRQGAASLPLVLSPGTPEPPVRSQEPKPAVSVRFRVDPRPLRSERRSVNRAAAMAARALRFSASGPYPSYRRRCRSSPVPR